MTDQTDDPDAMKEQLRKDVAAWSSARANDTSAIGVEPVAKPAPRASRAKAKATAPVIAAPVTKQPFKMSYDGTTDRDYIAHRIALGAR